MKRIPALVLALLAAGAWASAYEVKTTYPVGGAGSYDYVRFDAVGHRLFVSHQTKVEVLDSETGKSVGQITGLNGVHGIALATDLNKGFISNGLNGTVTVFDLKSLAVTGTIKTGGEKPDAVEYDPVTHLLVVSNGRSNNESLIDAATGQLKTLVPLLGNPESIVFDGQGHVLVNLESHNSVAQIELATGKVRHNWPVAPGEGPTGLAIDLVNRRAFVSCGGNKKMVIISADSGQKLTVLPIGDDSDAAGFDPGTLHAFSSNRDGTLTVIKENDCDHFHIEGTVMTARGAKTLAVDPVRHRVFLPVAQLAPGPDDDHPGPAVPDTFKVLVVQ